MNGLRQLRDARTDGSGDDDDNHAVVCNSRLDSSGARRQAARPLPLLLRPAERTSQRPAETLAVLKARHQHCLRSSVQRRRAGKRGDSKVGSETEGEEAENGTEEESIP